MIIAVHISYILCVLCLVVLGTYIKEGKTPETKSDFLTTIKSDDQVKNV